MSWRRDRLEVTELVQGLENNPLLIPKAGISWESQGGFHFTPARSLLVPEASGLPLGKLGMGGLIQSYLQGAQFEGQGAVPSLGHSI